MMLFFFKQKTAYDMRISDWSSDVCSSDLGAGGQGLLLLDPGCGGGGLHALAGAPGFRRRAARRSLSLCRSGLSRELFEHPSANPPLCRSALGRDGFTGNAHRAQVRSYGGPARVTRKKKGAEATFSRSQSAASARLPLRQQPPELAVQPHTHDNQRSE